jgi:SpoVK/Ycf46/Vps4 family AAA+-type ATPase
MLRVLKNFGNERRVLFSSAANNALTKLKKCHSQQHFSSKGVDLDHSAKIQLKALRQAMQGKGKFEELGIGGLDELLNNIFQRTFASRMLPPDTIDKLNLSHTKGLLLYGPPGTGKTLCARQIGSLLGARTPTHVNGPEIFSSPVGESEEAIRNIFKASEREWRMQGNKSPLHVIIFDEIDAICKRRDASMASGRSRVHDNVVNQLLTKIDGLQRQNNLLVIGVTNRKDLLDEALLRPGRLEVHVNIGLPDDKGRQQILQIYTRDLVKENMLEEDVRLSKLAEMTVGFTGAEIEGLVRSSVAYSLAEQQTKLSLNVNTMSDNDDISENNDDSTADNENDVDMFLRNQLKAKVGMKHFIKAIEEIERPAALGGIHGSIPIPNFKFGKIERTSPGYKLAEKSVMQSIGISRANVDAIKNSIDTNKRDGAPTSTSIPSSILLTGNDNVGRMTMIAEIAAKTDFEFVRVVRPRALVGMQPAHAQEYIIGAFTDAQRSPFSLLVLEDLDLLIDVCGEELETILYSLLTCKTENNCELIVIGICPKDNAKKKVLRCFEKHLYIPGADHNEMMSLIFNSNARSIDYESGKGIAAANEINNGDFLSLTNMIEATLYDLNSVNDDDDVLERFQLPTKMTPEQQEIYNDISKTRTTGVKGPFGPWLANPAIAEPAQTLGRVCRYETSFSPMESELIILMTATYFKSSTEWEIHVNEARRVGLRDDIIEALAKGEHPVFVDGEETLVALHNFVRELLVTSKVSNRCYKKLKKVYGDDETPLVEAVSIVGYYAYVAYTLNTFEIKP